MVVVLAGCTAQPAVPDASVDAAIGVDAAAFDVGPAWCYGPDGGVDAGIRLDGCTCAEPGRVVCAWPNDFVCSGGVWVIAADACGERDANVPRDGGVDDAAPSCDGGPAHGCPCDGSVLTVCGTDIDYVCSHGAWFGHAGLCAMLDAGMPCTDERRISCPGGHGVVCCYGQERWFFDGPCGGPPTDGGGPVCGALPSVGCPCDADAGTTRCDGSEELACVGGAWQPTSYACGSLCGSGP